MDDRFNMIAGWVLGAGIVALGASIVTAEIFHEERPETMGYPIEGVTGAAEDGGEAEQPIAFYLAAADVAAGQKLFAKCTTCHTIAKGGPSGTGPNLWGTLGSPIARTAGFAYSPDLKALGGGWDWDKMNAWIKAPRDLVSGTKMSFAGMGKPEDRANLIAYLNSQSDGPLPLPAAPAPSSAEGAEKGAAAATANMTEAQAATGGAANIGGEGAPSVSGNSQQTKTN